MNSELLYITRKLGYPSSFGTRSGLGDFLEQYPDGIYAETGSDAPMGWESAAVWFGGDSERAAARFERMMADRNELSRLFRTRVSGVLVFTFIYRLKSRMVTAIPIVGAQPVVDGPWMWMKPDVDCNLKIEKRGTPYAVELECSTDGLNWEDCVFVKTLFSKFLHANEKLYIRNKSELSTRFSIDINNRYSFSQSGNPLIECGGDIGSLLCKNPENAVLTPWCFNYLFYYTRITNTPLLSSANLANSCYRFMFRKCSQLREVRTMMLTSADNDIHLWLESVYPTGDFYCPAELTITTGASGIPSGWTRHDI